MDNETGNPLTWEDSFAIAKALIQQHPHVNLQNVSLSMIHLWTIALPTFRDDDQLVNDGILCAIYQEWFEEVTPL